jgi:endonuclease/exonuclease/phosphatase family metal-dependent hydrolase
MNAPSIRIATYNLQKCVGLDLRRRPERSLAVINALNAEIVVLQEADKRMSPRPSALPHDMLKAAGWRILSFGEDGNSPGDSLGWHGNAMLIRGSVEVIDAQPIDLPGLEPRGAIRADLITAIGPVRIFGKHLGLVKRHRLLQIAAIMRCARDLPTCATILAGDFNDWSRRSDGLDAAMGGLRFIETPPSFPAPRPVARLDRFALSPDLQAIRTGTYVARPARVASDHLPVWADITRRNP